MKIKIHIPTAQYAFLEASGEIKDLDTMIKLHNQYGETTLTKKEEGKFVEIKTFTNETIYYNDLTHIYKDKGGNRLISGSAYKKSKEKPFPKDIILPKVAKKYGVSEQDIDDMWSANGRISRTFGNAIHFSMEQWFKYKDKGCEEKEYHLPKHPILKKAVETFPRKNDKILPEIMVSSIKNKMVGQIDGLVVTGDKKGIIIDYKTDANIEPEPHFLQLSFYAFILKQFGWEIEGLEIWNYTNEWTKYKSDIMSLK